MTARIIEIDLSDTLKRDGYMFHCPLTGTPIIGDRDHAFENFASPYFLFSITQDGTVDSRKGDLPEPVGSGFKRAMKALAAVGGEGPEAVNTHDLHIFMANEMSPCLPDTTVIFEIDPPADRQSDARLWVAMDFTLPAAVVNVDSLEQVTSIAAVE